VRVEVEAARAPPARAKPKARARVDAVET